MSATTVEERRFTRAEYDRMIDHGIFGPEERAELIDGQILTMAPPKPFHATAVGLAQDALRAAFGSGFHVRVQQPLALDPMSEPEPDLAVVPGSPRDYLEEHPASAVLLVEVSETSLRFDREWKGSLYARGGGDEYWIVNVIERTLEVYRDSAPTDAARYGWAYRTVERLGSSDEVSPLAIPDAHVRVADVLP